MDFSYLMQTAALGGWFGIGSIILLSYALEDGALVLAAILASTEIIHPFTAWLAAFFGIFTGDLGVYFIGRYLRRPLVVKRSLTMPTTLELVICRFTPGLRTLAFSWCGLSKMPFGLFSPIVFFSGLVWTLGVFMLVYWAGLRDFNIFSHYTWFVVFVVIAIVWYRHRQVLPSFLRQEDV